MTDMQMVQGPGGWAVLALLGLGALHGINPAMGWLFAVALGLQEKRARAVWRALPPLALGHALAIAVVVAVFTTIGVLVPMRVLRWGVALLLAGFGVYRLFRHAHFRYGGMRVGARELTIWSFLMATAHGAGLMVLPFVLEDEAGNEVWVPLNSWRDEDLLMARLLRATVERRVKIEGDPIEAIKLRMEQRGLTRRDLERVLGTKSRVSEVLNRKRPLTMAMVRRLHSTLGIPAESLIQPTTRRANQRRGGGRAA